MSEEGRAVCLALLAAKGSPGSAPLGIAQARCLDEDAEVPWATCDYSPEQVDEAGRTLAYYALLDDVPDATLSVVDGWRSSHAFPLNTLQVGLRRYARDVDVGALVAQRLKRLSSIHAKVRRFDWLPLSEMQDLGGCRAVVRGAPQVDELAKRYRNSDIKHILDKSDDYIAKPKKSGYRGVHLIYRYRSDRSETYNGHKVEIQLRSRLQHAWATAVETAGAFTREALKSSLGDPQWLRFFALMGSAMALRERRPLVPGTPIGEAELKAELRKLSHSLEVEKRLLFYGALGEQVEASAKGKAAHYFLVRLDLGTMNVNVRGFRADELKAASDELSMEERTAAGNPNLDVVLVSVADITALKRAYPNYFADTRAFIDALRKATA